MSELFLKVINLSISASWLILAVLILRIVLRKAPRWVSVLLWGIVAVRLLLPFSVESALSLIPSAETIPVDIEMAAVPAIDSGIRVINSVVNPMISQSNTPAVGASINPLQVMAAVFAYIWVLGIAVLLIYIAVSYWNLHRKVETAVLYLDNIFQSENVSSPFVLGIIRPRIYLPFKMDGKNLEHIVAHEKAHICRKDHWWKPLGFLLLAFYWFNPLMWLAYILLCRDIELACDEKVIGKLGSEQRADYTKALLSCSVSRRMAAASPLAFGEVGVKERARSVMNYKKPALWVIVVSIIACVIVAVCFLTNPKQDDYDEKNIVPDGSQEGIVYPDEEIGMDDLGQYRTEYIGDAPNVSAIAQNLPYPEGYSYSSIELQSSTEPYELIVYLDGSGNAQRTDFKQCAETAFDLIGNMGIISFSNSGDKTVLFSFNRREIESDSSAAGEDVQAGAETASSLDGAISKAVLDHTANDMPPGVIHVESHYITYTEENGGRVTVYMQAHESSYVAYDGRLYQESGSDIPTAITFSVSESGEYTLEEYWTPREGSYYVPDLQEKFPEKALDVLNAGHGEIQKLSQECNDKAMAQFEGAGGLEIRIAGLLDSISSSPAGASNPGDYIGAHDAEYQELIGYGQYTLRYCFTEFLAGGQTGLRGHIMRLILDELAPEAQIKLEAETGQEYFDEWKAYAQRAAEQNDAEWVEKNQPAIWILLQMMDG